MKISRSAIATLVIVGTALGGSAIVVNARNSQTDVDASSIAQIITDPAQKQSAPINTAAPIGTIENVTTTPAPTATPSTDLAPAPTPDLAPIAPTPKAIPSMPPVVIPVTPPNYGGSGNGDDSEDSDYNDDGSGYGSNQQSDDGEDNEGDYED